MRPRCTVYGERGQCEKPPTHFLLWTGALRKGVPQPDVLVRCEFHEGFEPDSLLLKRISYEEFLVLQVLDS